MQLSDTQEDALIELINIGVGRAAGMLNEMLNAHVVLRVPSIRLLTCAELESEMIRTWGDKLSIVRMQFKGPFAGTASLVFSSKSAARLIDLILGEMTETQDLDAIRVGTLTEVGNIVLNGVMGSIANLLKLQVNYSVPTYQEDNILEHIKEEEHKSVTVLLVAHTHLKIEEQMIECDILLLFELGTFDSLITLLDRLFHEV